jgi:hypothetical protein
MPTVFVWPKLLASLHRVLSLKRRPQRQKSYQSKEIIVNQLRLITPVYNDWTSFGMLLQELDKVAASLPLEIFVSAIDDGSEQATPIVTSDKGGLRHIVGVEVLSLAVNVGHQRAIAIGLCAAAQDHDFNAILIMDADGEDPPHAIEALIKDLGDRKDFCVVAQRRKRVETASFKFFYLTTCFQNETNKK